MKIGWCNGLECSSRLHLVPHMSFAVYWHLQCMMLSCAASRSPPSLSAQPKCPLWEFSLYGNPLYYRCSFSYNFIYTPNWIFLPWNEASVEDIEEQNKDHLWSSPRTRVLGLSHLDWLRIPTSHGTPDSEWSNRPTTWTTAGTTTPSVSNRIVVPPIRTKNLHQRSQNS